MRLYGAISKVTPEDDGTVRVEGIASSEAIDEQGEIVRADAIRTAIPDYMRFPALREMHQLSAAGTTIEAVVDDDGMTRIVARVVDPVAISKVKNLVYRGFSIGGRVTKRDSVNSKIITGIQLNEISLVDRPANPEAVMSCWKASISEIERTDDMDPALATIGDTPAGEALAAAASTDPGAEAAKTPAAVLVEPVQIWACGDTSHTHLGKGDATKCIEKRAAAGENGGTQWEPKPPAEAAVVEQAVDTPDPVEPAAKAGGEQPEDDGAAEAGGDGEAEAAAEAAPEVAGEAEADAGAEGAAEADPPADGAEKAAAEPSEAEQAIAKAAELTERARAALNLPAETASETPAETDPDDGVDQAVKVDDVKKSHPIVLLKSLADAGNVALAILVLDNATALAREAGEENELSKSVAAAADFLRAQATQGAASILNEIEGVDEALEMSAQVEDLRKAGLVDLADFIEKAKTSHSAKNQELLDMGYECASRAAGLDGCSKAATNNFDAASKCLMAAGAKGWDDARKASAEGLMIDALAKGAQHKVLADAAHDCIGKVMSGSSCQTSKASDDTKANLSMAHDHLCAAGATCPGMSQKEAALEAAEGSGQLAKVAAENAQLLKAVQDFAPLVERLLETNTSLADQIAKIDEKVDRIDQQEVPPRGLARSAGLFALSKTQDNGAVIAGSGAPAAPVSPDEILKSINAMPESRDKAYLLMRIAHTNPQPVKMVSQAEMNLPAQ